MPVLVHVSDNSHKFIDYISSHQTSFSFRLIDNKEVLRLLNKVNKSKGKGLDNLENLDNLDKISGRLIGECADLISPYVSHIFNSSLVNSKVPDWKISRVTSLFKQSKRSFMNNYRPISIIAKPIWFS